MTEKKSFEFSLLLSSFYIWYTFHLIYIESIAMSWFHATTKWWVRRRRNQNYKEKIESTYQNTSILSDGKKVLHRSIAYAFNNNNFFLNYKLVHLKLEHFEIAYFFLSLFKRSLKRTTHNVCTVFLWMVIHFTVGNISFAFHNHIVLIFQFDYNPYKNRLF